MACGHVLCHGCLVELQQAAQGTVKCPMCRKPIGEMLDQLWTACEELYANLMNMNCNHCSKGISLISISGSRRFKHSFTHVNALLEMCDLVHACSGFTLLWRVRPRECVMA